MIVAALWLAACAPSPAPGGSDGSASGAVDSSTPFTPPTTSEPVPTGSVEGVVAGPDGAPRAGVTVTLCHGACRFADTGADGAFRFDAVAPDRYALHFTTFGDGGLADVLVAIDVADGEQRVLEAPVPRAVLGPAVQVPSPAEVEVVPGLFASVDPAAVDMPPFGPDAVEIAGARPATWPPGLPAGDVLDVVYLAPFDAAATPGLPLRVDNRWGLAPGETVAVWASRYLDDAWVDAGTLTVSTDATELTGGAVPVFSTVVLVRSP